MQHKEFTPLQGQECRKQQSVRNAGSSISSSSHGSFSFQSFPLTTIVEHVQTSSSAVKLGILGFLCLCSDPQEVTVKPGQDVSLLCKAPTGGPISLIAWSRPDLKADGYVFFLRDGLHMNYQHPSYVGRVELRDPDMKDGDASVVLKNVTVNDSGTYECRVGKKNKPELIGIIRLTVSGSAGNISAGGNKEQGNKYKGNTDQGKKYKGNKYKGNKDQGNKDQGNMDQGNMDQGNKDKGTKDQRNKDQGNKDQGNKDQGNKDHGNLDERNKHVGLTASLLVVVAVVLFCL
ncbi:uncharacterized protein LOC123966602 [Micropterus dolomieu]|uniref:uncharacterized protein LOC123966602 n=1 Tax=Micropterus dolomieu TaxID=147949 RepID=UPI001E8E6AAF|nr:uncharacterized protein LOC123966602 [Micropterus dolomieu]